MINSDRVARDASYRHHTTSTYSRHIMLSSLPIITTCRQHLMSMITVVRVAYLNVHQHLKGQSVQALSRTRTRCEIEWVYYFHISGDGLKYFDFVEGKGEVAEAGKAVSVIPAQLLYNVSTTSIDQERVSSINHHSVISIS